MSSTSVPCFAKATPAPSTNHSSGRGDPRTRAPASRARGPVASTPRRGNYVGHTIAAENRRWARRELQEARAGNAKGEDMVADTVVIRPDPTPAASGG